jgi:hypothetical protein
VSRTCRHGVLFEGSEREAVVCRVRCCKGIGSQQVRHLRKLSINSFSTCGWYTLNVPASCFAPSFARLSFRNELEISKSYFDIPCLTAQSSMSRSQTDKWVRLALISECLRQYGRGRAERLIQVKEQIHRFLDRLLGATGEERATAHKEAIWQKLLKTDCIEWVHIYNQSVPNEKDRLHDDPVPKAIARAIERVDLRPIAEALKEMPVRARGGDDRISECIAEARKALRAVEDELWKLLLAVSS